jgi:NAD(P)-dependent dehydrogenase (short-subunit alcohol dehydrogenase family)
VARRGAAASPLCDGYGEFSSAQRERVVEEIRDAGGTAAACRVDVTSEASARSMVELAVRTFGGLLLAHNNAGIGGAPRSVS